MESVFKTIALQYVGNLQEDVESLRVERERTMERKNYKQAMALIHAALTADLCLYVAFTEEGKEEIPSCVINVFEKEREMDFRVIHNGKIDFTLIPSEERCNARLEELYKQIPFE